MYRYLVKKYSIYESNSWRAYIRHSKYWDTFIFLPPYDIFRELNFPNVNVSEKLWYKAQRLYFISNTGVCIRTNMNHVSLWFVMVLLLLLYNHVSWLYWFDNMSTFAVFCCSIRGLQIYVNRWICCAYNLIYNSNVKAFSVFSDVIRCCAS